MASIHMDGEETTAKISDWSIWWSEKYEALQLVCHFPSKEVYTRHLSNCRVFPTREPGKMLLTEQRIAITKPIEKAIIYGDRYAVVHFANTARPCVYKFDGIRLGMAFLYFV